MDFPDIAPALASYFYDASIPHCVVAFIVVIAVILQLRHKRIWVASTLAALIGGAATALAVEAGSGDLKGLMLLPMSLFGAVVSALVAGLLAGFYGNRNRSPKGDPSTSVDP
ncbi:MAG: hypothetical protein OSB12_04010 [Planctomycetota bacterium]|nr:hypothetical protein [Planctomycetota bacterium]